MKSIRPKLIFLLFSDLCRSSVISLAADFNDGALECNCDMEGSIGLSCEEIGGQCSCKPNVIGRRCTKCKPGYFGYPECKQCNCPETATCDEETGKETRLKYFQVLDHEIQKEITKLQRLNCQ